MVAIVALATMTTFLAASSASLMIELGWIAKLQFAPALLSMSMISVVIILLLTLLFGRIYCSMICPMGIMLDLAAATNRRRHYRYSPAHNKIRLSLLILVVLATLAGTSLLLALVEPYGSFSRIITWLLRPLILSGQYTVALKAALPATLLALLTFVVLALWARKKGRIYCNTVCPVGTLLGMVSKNALMHIDINTDLCVNCRKCEQVCKSSCIDLNDHVADMSRCVVCFNCIDACSNNAIKYTHRNHRLSTPLMMKVPGISTATTASANAPTAITADPLSTKLTNSVLTPATDSVFDNKTTDKPVISSSPKPNAASIDFSTATVANNINQSSTSASGMKLSRRQFLTLSSLAIALPAISAIEKKLPTQSSAPSSPCRPVSPPGVKTIDSLLRLCVGCGACISACRSKVLRPAVNEYGMLHPLVPVMDFDNSSCLFDCNDCTQVCPTGALRPISIQEKQNTAIGLATLDADLCVGCGRCARQCPKSAIEMKNLPGRERRIAIIDQSKCIGCGVCQNVCPVTPKAITVHGLRR